MNDWQKRITSSSLLPLGSKSEPPLPPPIGSVVSAFLNTCSNARNFSMPEVDRRVEPQAALVRADRAVHLDAEAAVDLDLAAVVDPGDAEHHHAFGLDHALEDLVIPVHGLAVEDELDRVGDLPDRLMELELAGVLRLDVRHQPIDVRAHGDVPPGVRLPAEA